MNITSSAFTEGGSIPSQYTCDGADVSPPLAWGVYPTVLNPWSSSATTPTPQWARGFIGWP